MKKGILILFISCCLLLGCKTVKLDYTPYYTAVYKADSLMTTSNFKKSYGILDSIFNLYKPLNSSYQEYFTFTKLSYLLKLKYKNKLINSITDYGLDKDYFKYDSILNKAFNEIKISDKEYQKYRAKYINSIDLNLRKEIKEMVFLDQKYRKENIDSESANKIILQDLENQNLLKVLFNKNIYPNERVIGNYSIDKKSINIVAVLLHTNDSIRINYFLPKIKEFVIAGKCSPVIYGAMVDQYHLYNDENQFYGTYNINRIPIKHYFKYNSRRKTIGLPTIEFDLYKIKQFKP
ncbi:hypothetical protein [uncultured Tenacibaculum sp.]|uniref:hypothetical protein n=1 Tax=uncultured Tenacibaculum sp. TaxID=174713 RepID=UPI0026381958|nr:hypothetical protein [uncultured Tenacibaculum sp.]